LVIVSEYNGCQKIITADAEFEQIKPLNAQGLFAANFVVRKEPHVRDETLESEQV
jgi:hypothetical protein